MKEQNRVVLSIGSNQGDRLNVIEQCIKLIQREVGTVVDVSRIYETPAWGFESEPFLNCAILLHSYKSAQNILEDVLNVEKQLGRIRKISPEYQARIIDVDVITFNEDVIITDTLIVPHPHMQNRLFVLLPMQDLKMDWTHPKLQKTVTQLVVESNDASECKVFKVVKKPLEEYQFVHYNYIAIEGNIGAGKTTLVNKIADDFNAKTVLERFADNPFLPKFYKDQNRYAFSLEMSFLADRYQQLSDDLAQFDLFKDFIVADYHIFKSLIFAKVTLTEDEYRLYRKLFDIIYKEMPKPDLYVYLYQNTDRLLQNIKTRGREYEKDIAPDYLERINQGYLDYIKSQTNLNVLIIDMSEKDFVENHEDYLFVLDAIQNKIKDS
ncbi:2-amino-4-hydroxy-6-hydroxymethyldihydropteridine diphosphokinase [Flavobacterium sp. '19STA2R22 D10 B1']|uniref:2-amino-4-hydroxy-6- hydroxymethyldihydropteridine diphosphokinase n=1 Tax=Flavobacterium aerium TaxID=3037261 RepID=UPI00278C2363|nr:2-amino-4-hydroxy-6-hydroxymethyldihydropteridine diphosphokinase [Flavobacterium sp. '19STA2R22 D10 B1']